MITEFTVKRSEWLRGGLDLKKSKLMNDMGERCCLGFLGQACGINDKNMIGLYRPYETYTLNKSGYGLWPAFLVDYDNEINTSSCNAIMAVNDSYYYSDAKREELLKKEFKKHGITINFED